MSLEEMKILNHGDWLVDRRNNRYMWMGKSRFYLDQRYRIFCPTDFRHCYVSKRFILEQLNKVT